MAWSWYLSVLFSILSYFSIESAKATQEVLAEDAKSLNGSLLWGPYKPNLYFGVRPRLPKSLTAGLIWAKVDSYEGIQQSTLNTYL